MKGLALKSIRIHQVASVKHTPQKIQKPFCILTTTIYPHKEKIIQRWRDNQNLIVNIKTFYKFVSSIQILYQLNLLSVTFYFIWTVELDLLSTGSCPQMAAIVRAVPDQRQEPGWQGLSTWATFCCFAWHVNREPDQNRSSQDTNKLPYGIPALPVAALPTLPQRQLLQLQVHSGIFLFLSGVQGSNNEKTEVKNLYIHTASNPVKGVFWFVF